MNFIQTFRYPAPINPFQASFGWFAPEYHLMSWALSCLQIKKIYGAVDLYASSNAAKLLVDVLELPYTNLHITHDHLYVADERLWALPKILTYSLQEKSFLHLDGDVFIFKPFSDTLLSGGLIAQNVEEATGYYTTTQRELIEHFSFFPVCVKDDFTSTVPIKAVNAGILGGSNVDFIKKYAYTAFEYIDKNKQHLSKINADRFNVFFEQHLFYSLAREKNLPISLLFNDIVNDNEYRHLGEFHEVPCSTSYLHLLGHFKRD